MDDFILIVLDLIFWLFLVDFSKKGQAAFKVLIWATLVALLVGGFIVFTI